MKPLKQDDVQVKIEQRDEDNLFFERESGRNETKKRGRQYQQTEEEEQPEQSILANQAVVHTKKEKKQPQARKQTKNVPSTVSDPIECSVLLEKHNQQASAHNAKTTTTRSHKEFTLEDIASLICEDPPDVMDVRDEQLCASLLTGMDRGMLEDMASYFLTAEGIRSDERQELGPPKWNYTKGDSYDSFDYYVATGCECVQRPTDTDKPGIEISEYASNVFQTHLPAHSLTHSLRCCGVHVVHVDIHRWFCSQHDVVLHVFLIYVFSAALGFLRFLRS